MANLESNKIFSALLVAGIAFGAMGVLADKIVAPKELEASVLKIAGSAAPSASAQEAPKPLPPIGPMMMTADADAGGSTAKKLCSACHNFAEGAGKKVGPGLYGVVGRAIASTVDFSYSDALKAHSGAWTYDELNNWLHKPSQYASGTKMGFAGISSDADRASVIMYLRSLSHSPMPMPTAAK